MSTGRGNTCPHFCRNCYKRIHTTFYACHNSGIASSLHAECEEPYKKTMATFAMSAAKQHLWDMENPKPTVRFADLTPYGKTQTRIPAQLTEWDKHPDPYRCFKDAAFAARVLNWYVKFAEERPK